MRIAAFIILLVTCVQPAGGQARVPVAARSVETAVGTAPFITAAIGTTRGERTAIFAMVGGMVGGAALGIAAYSRTRNCDDCMFGEMYVASAVGIGMVSGAAVGALIGVMSWKNGEKGDRARRP
jgi:hypothetical protein